jgi:large subunit ribosomal protein L4
LRSALSAKAADKGIVIVEELEFKQPKTRQMIETLNNLVGDSSVLVLMPARNKSYETALRSAHNIKSAKILLAGYLNVRDLLGYEKIILPLKTLDAITTHLG